MIFKKWFPGNPKDDLLNAFENKRVKNYIINQHRIVHAIRDISLSEYENGQIDRINLRLDSICDLCQEMVSNYTNIDKLKIHCTIKILSSKDAKISTIARSEIFSGRPVDIGLESEFDIAGNSIFSTLLGSQASIFPHRSIHCFCTLDTQLNSWRMLEQRDRNFVQWYKSCISIVLRVKFRDCSGKTRYKNYGVLTIDCVDKNAFPLPDIFEFLAEPDNYESILNKSAFFNSIALIADGLAIAINSLIILENQLEGDQDVV